MSDFSIKAVAANEYDAATEAINHPSHYNVGGIEVIDAINAWKLGFELGNAVKYIARAGHKADNDIIQDLEKAIWYINHEIDKIKGERGGENG